MSMILEPRVAEARIRELERTLSAMERIIAQQADHIRELEAEVERLNRQIAEWSKANLRIVARCSTEEKRAKELEAEVARLRGERNLFEAVWRDAEAGAEWLKEGTTP